MEEKELNEKKYELLTDEQLKEVAAGAGPILSAPSEALNKACKRLNLKGCLEKPSCMWKDGICIWNPNS